MPETKNPRLNSVLNFIKHPVELFLLQALKFIWKAQWGNSKSTSKQHWKDFKNTKKIKITHEKMGKWERTVLLDVRKLFSYLHLQTAWSNYQYATDNTRTFFFFFPVGEHWGH